MWAIQSDSRSLYEGVTAVAAGAQFYACDILLNLLRMGVQIMQRTEGQSGLNVRPYGTRAL